MRNCCCCLPWDPVEPTGKSQGHTERVITSARNCLKLTRIYTTGDKTTRTPQIKHTKSNRKRCQKKYSPVVVLFHPQRYFLPFFIGLMVTHICWNQQKWRRMRDWGQNYVIKVQEISAVKWETRGWWQLVGEKRATVALHAKRNQIYWGTAGLVGRDKAKVL